MENQADDRLLKRALYLLTPDIFQHPVWIRFAAHAAVHAPTFFQPLIQEARVMQANGDYACACDLLFLTAAQQIHLSDPLSALDNLDQAYKIARRHHLLKREVWSNWGAAAVCAQFADYPRSAGYLQRLQTLLRSNGNWVLADIIEMIGECIEKIGSSGKRPAQGPDSFVQTALLALNQWGKTAAEPGGSYPADAGEYNVQPGQGWHAAWNKLKQFIKREKQRPPSQANLNPGSLRSKASVTNGFELLPSSDEPQVVQPASSYTEIFQAETLQEAAELAGSPVEVQSAKDTRLPEIPAAVTEEQPRIQQSVPITALTSGQAPSLAVYCLGAFKVFLNNELVTSWNGQKGASILKYLMANRERPVPKDILMDIFWPEAGAEVARRNLHQAIYGVRQTVRRALPDLQLILFENDCYRISSDVEVWLDSEEFERFARAGRAHLEAGQTAEAIEAFGVAEELYSGDFLEEELYEDWPRPQREYFRAFYLEISGQIIEYYIKNRQITPAKILCQKVLTKDRCNEQAYRGLIQCYLLQGQRQLAIREYQVCVQALKDELGLPPSAETRELYRRITAG